MNLEKSTSLTNPAFSPQLSQEFHRLCPHSLRQKLNIKNSSNSTWTRGNVFRPCFKQVVLEHFLKQLPQQIALQCDNWPVMLADAMTFRCVLKLYLLQQHVFLPPFPNLPYLFLNHSHLRNNDSLLPETRHLISCFTLPFFLHFIIFNSSL